jgi:hypothetical protein
MELMGDVMSLQLFLHAICPMLPANNVGAAFSRENKNPVLQARPGFLMLITFVVLLTLT